MSRPEFGQHADKFKSALLIVDVQNFCAIPNVGLNANRNEENDRYFFDRIGQVMVPNIKRLQEACRSHHVEVVFTVIECLTLDGRDQSLDYKLTMPPVPKGHYFAEVLDELKPQSDEICFPKTSHSVFNSTNIDYILRNIGIQHLAVVGIVTNQCIEGTIRDAADRGYNCTLVTDATAAHSPETQASAELNLKGFSRICTTEQVIKEIQKHCKT